MKITDEIGQKILSEFARGVSVEDLCRRHGVSRDAFYRWRRRHFERLEQSARLSERALRR